MKAGKKWVTVIWNFRQKLNNKLKFLRHYLFHSIYLKVIHALEKIKQII